MEVTQFEVTIIENGESIYDDPPKFIKGKNLGDALREILSADKDAPDPTHVNVNGTTYAVGDLDSKTIEEDIEIELLTKSNSGK